MQLNNKLFKGLRGIRGFWISLLAIVFGVAFVGLGIYFLATDPSKKYEETTATITSIEYDMVGEDRQYYVIIDYTDKEGVAHTGVRYDGYDSSWTVGQEIKIKYNVDNPEEVSSPGGSIIVPILCIGLGGIALVAGVFGAIKTTKILKRKPEEQSENAAAIKEENDAPEENVKDAKFFFHLTGKLNQSYAVENVEGAKLYECNLKRFSLLAASTYEFVDNRNGSRKQLKIGKTVTSSSEGGLPLVGDLLSSYFKIDGVNCWDYIAQRGYEIKHILAEGKTIINYQVYKDGKLVAGIYPADKRKPFDEKSVGYLFMNKGYYRLEISDAKLSDIVMIAFIVGRTDMVE